MFKTHRVRGLHETGVAMIMGESSELHCLALSLSLSHASHPESLTSHTSPTHSSIAAGGARHCAHKPPAHLPSASLSRGGGGNHYRPLFAKNGSRVRLSFRPAFQRSEGRGGGCADQAYTSPLTLDSPRVRKQPCFCPRRFVKHSRTLLLRSSLFVCLQRDCDRAHNDD
jgi:hypothetical protein